MKKYSILNLIAVLVVSFVAWIYCIAIAVLGLIYQFYPGQDNMSILIGTLPTVVTMITAFSGPFLMKKLTRKGAVIISLAISLVCGLTILWMDMSLIGVILCSCLCSENAAGLIPAANASIVTIVAPTSIKDKVIGWHNAIDDARNVCIYIVGRYICKRMEIFARGIRWFLFFNSCTYNYCVFVS
ncbi:MAG: hypothetical protein V8R61_03580 [Enterocloster sp.]